MTHINWHGDKVLKEITGSDGPAWKRVMAAGTYLKARIQANVSIATEAAGPSKPREYPHIGYHPPIPGGTLRKSIFLRPRKNALAVDIGTKLVYGIHWELTNRPYIRRTYAEQLGQIKAILEGRMTRTIEDVRAEAGAMRERHKAQKATILAKKKVAREVKQAKKAGKRAAFKAKEQAKRSRQRRGKK